MGKGEKVFKNKVFSSCYPKFAWLVGSKNNVCYSRSANAIIQFVILTYLKQKMLSFQIRVAFYLLRSRCKSIGYMNKMPLLVR